jgi:membrane-bound lytic murein transglycosylase MltF
LNINISGIEKLDPNIHAGTKYLRFMADRYFPEDGEFDALNRMFFTFASYNAGPAKKGEQVVLQVGLLQQKQIMTLA